MRWLLAQARADRGAWALWLPVCFGTGIALYFQLSEEPRGGVAGLAVVPGFLLAALGRDDVVKAAGWAILMVGLGFGAAQWRTQTVAQPVLAKRQGPLMVRGEIERIEPMAGGGRILLRTRVNSGGRPLPPRIRLTVRGAGAPLAGFRPGVRIRALAVLRPPPPPVLPGAFDFQRRAFFQGIGAYGFTLGTPVAEGFRPPADIRDAFTRRLDDVRRRIAEDVRQSGPGPPAAVAAALLTGHRGYIDETTLQALRDAGIAHLLAISGLHIGLVAGLVFGAVRLALALMPRFGLRSDAKKIAAVTALPAAFAYALLAGLTVPTERALWMTALILVGVLIDRKAMTLRTLAWAALAIMAIKPESVVGPGFQMSFAAVTVLVSAYAFLTARRRALGHERARGPLAVLGRYGAGVLLTTVLASAATAPFAVYHFQHAAAFGLIANAVAVPLAAFWVMPTGIAALALMPMGLETGPLWLMREGIALILETATWVAALPGAAADIPAPPAWSLGVVIAGGLWLTLWRACWRLLGVPVLMLGLSGPIWAVTPDIIVDGDARVVAVRAEAGLLASTLRAARFETRQWQRWTGSTAPPVAWPESPETAVSGLRCDARGCAMGRNGRTAAISLNEASLADDCRRSDLVIALVPVRIDCRPRFGVIDRFDLWREGTHAVYLSRDGPDIRRVNAERGRRPWVNRPD